MRTYYEWQEHEAPFPFDFNARYVVNGSAGVAWNAFTYEFESDEDTEWSGVEYPTGRILAHMVGDDRIESFDPEDLEPIGEIDYCACCGQIGCMWDGRDRDETATIERTP